jgi:hypothetical protein
MKPVDQTILHDPANGRYGNCFAAFLASTLEIPIEDVPHFADGWPEPDEFNRRINAFLAPLNLAFMCVNIEDWCSSMGVTGLVHELFGLSPRGADHATVGIDGVMTHDPHPSKAGLLTPAEEWGVFVVLDPSKPAGEGDSMKANEIKINTAYTDGRGGYRVVLKIESRPMHAGDPKTDNVVYATERHGRQTIKCTRLASFAAAVTKEIR